MYKLLEDFWCLELGLLSGEPVAQDPLCCVGCALCVRIKIIVILGPNKRPLMAITHMQPVIIFKGHRRCWMLMPHNQIVYSCEHRLVRVQVDAVIGELSLWSSRRGSEGRDQTRMGDANGTMGV